MPYGLTFLLLLLPWPIRVLPWPVRILPRSTPTGRLQARARASSNHYSLVRPHTLSCFSRIVWCQNSRLYTLLRLNSGTRNKGAALINFLWQRVLLFFRITFCVFKIILKWHCKEVWPIAPLLVRDSYYC